MRTLMMVVAVALVAACGQAPGNAATGPAPTAEQAQASAPAAPANNCPATASSQWSAGSAVFTIEAASSGANCAEATASITIRDAAGAVVHTGSYPAGELIQLTGAESTDDMQRRLREWITPAGASMDSTGDLAEWVAGAPQPSYAEVPFQPSEGVTRPIYEALRAADAPMYCYQQSEEGGLCFAMRDGALKEIGLQTYAG